MSTTSEKNSGGQLLKSKKETKPNKTEILDTKRKKTLHGLSMWSDLKIESFLQMEQSPSINLLLTHSLTYLGG